MCETQALACDFSGENFSHWLQAETDVFFLSCWASRQVAFLIYTFPKGVALLACQPYAGISFYSSNYSLLYVAQGFISFPMSVLETDNSVTTTSTSTPATVTATPLPPRSQQQHLIHFAVKFLFLYVFLVPGDFPFLLAHLDVHLT